MLLQAVFKIKVDISYNRTKAALPRCSAHVPFRPNVVRHLVEIMARALIKVLKLLYGISMLLQAVFKIKVDISYSITIAALPRLFAHVPFLPMPTGIGGNNGTGIKYGFKIFNFVSFTKTFRSNLIKKADISS